MSNGIILKQTNPDSLTNLHAVTQMVLSPLTAGPLSKGGLLQETQQTGSMREFLFEMRKDGGIYWIGAAVPQGTSDFSKVQVFFHPTVVQHTREVVVVHGKKRVVDKTTVHAAEDDYPTFRGGWSGKLQRYVAMQGGQLAGARKTALIVPFMTMAAYSGGAPAYMFATRPVETLNAIMTAVRGAAMTTPTSGGSSLARAINDAVNELAAVVEDEIDPVSVAKIGVSSFSSGVIGMRLFIRTFGKAGLIAETTDFDGPFITSEHKVMTRAPGASARVFSQVPPDHPQSGWLTMPPPSFQNIYTWHDKGPHAQIGWMSFFMASLGSVIA
jgi:hypothetical protein